MKTKIWQAVNVGLLIVIAFATGLTFRGDHQSAGYATIAFAGAAYVVSSTLEGGNRNMAIGAAIALGGFFLLLELI